MVKQFTRPAEFNCLTDYAALANHTKSIKAQIKVYSVVYFFSRNDFVLREICSKCESNKSTVRKFLNDLTSGGLLTMKIHGTAHVFDKTGSTAVLSKIIAGLKKQLVDNQKEVDNRRRKRESIARHAKILAQGKTPVKRKPRVIYKEFPDFGRHIDVRLLADMNNMSTLRERVL